MSETPRQELLRSASLCILGVDPGLTGAIAFYFPTQDAISADDTPVAGGDINAGTLAAPIEQMRPDLDKDEEAANRGLLEATSGNWATVENFLEGSK